MKLRVLFRFLEKVLAAVIVILFIGIVVSALSQVVSRYVFNSPFMWTEEAARYLGIWCTLMTAGILLGRNMHLSIDLLVEKLPAAPQKALRVFVFLIIIVFASVLVVYGFNLLSKVSKALSPALRIPMSYVYLAVPVGSLIFLIYAILGLIRTTVSLLSSAKRAGGADVKES
jgi:TRAP-type C4-dicarboxylate transport system permease small subunit